MDERERSGAWALIRDRRFLGLAMMEFWERFAMAGVKSLLVVILADHVLAGDMSDVFGAAALHRLFDGWFGSLSRTGMASQIYGYANALLYAAILIGGLAGDLVLGRRGAVFAGGGVMGAGLALMLAPVTFLPGLALFAVGTGTLKGNLSAQLGGLFTTEVERQQGYALYLGFLNAGVIGGPLVCGTLAVAIGWHYAVGAAGIALAIGLVGYAMALPPAATTDLSSPDAQPGDAVEPGPRTIGLLVAGILSVYCCYSAYDQLGDIFLLWAREKVDLRVAGWAMPVSWFLSFDGLFTLLLIAGWQILTPRLAARGIILDPIAQILLGSLFCVAGYLLLAATAAGAGAPVPLVSALAYLLFVDIAVVLIWPSGLSLIAAVAPPRWRGAWMGIFYLHGFFSSLWVGISGSYYDRLPDEAFWLLHAIMAGVGAVLALLAGLLRRGAPRQAITTSA